MKNHVPNFLHPAIEALVDGNTTFSIKNNKVTYENESYAPTEEQIIAKQAELKEAWDAKEYQRNRVYPSIAEQLDMLWHDMNNGVIEKSTTFYEAIKKVKDGAPKPN